MNEDKSPKVCPLLKQHCLELSCAWYVQHCRRCAMLVMGEAGEIATTTAIMPYTLMCALTRTGRCASALLPGAAM